MLKNRIGAEAQAGLLLSSGTWTCLWTLYACWKTEMEDVEEMDEGEVSV